jgi:hypothetical protein
MTMGACGSDDDEVCDPVANTGCEDDLVCERVTGGAEPICVGPVVLRGKVFALPGTTGIAGARVVALDVNGAAVSSVAVTGTDGTYELRVPSERNADGTVVGQNVTLRSDAQGYLSFPSGIRTALPIDTRAAALVGGRYVVMSALTDVGLIAFQGGTGGIAGTVAVPEGRPGILVVAEGGGRPGLTAIADRDGDYRIFNAVAGTYTVKAYAMGANHDAVQVTVAENMTATADVPLASGKPPSTVTGSVNIVNPEMGTDTSVVLVVESTFSETLARGETPPGLRAGDVINAFSIAGVPEGRYVVLAGFENDLLVRDPDTSIGGTQIVHITVTSGADTAAGSGFKVTGARATVGPGRDAPEAVTSRPTLSWADDTSEDIYKVFVYDALGTKVWEHDVPRETSRDPQIAYEGPFQPGMYYQFRAVSYKDGVPISSTEDLRGVFYVP